MPVVMSVGALVDVQTPWWPLTQSQGGSLRLYDEYTRDYAALYREQPNVRVCVDFLARNIAQLGLHVFRRVSDTDRERLTDHPLAQVLSKPLPAQFKVTRYRLIESLVSDLGVYFNAYWLKVRREDGAAGGDPPLGLLRVPPAYVEVSGGLFPSGYTIALSGGEIEVAPEDIVHFRGYNAESAVIGLSPLETLRRVLAEEHAAGDYREHFWANAARMAGIIERPATAPEWSPAARQRFKAEFEALYSGGPNSGRTAILEEGMEWKEASFNPQESEYLGGRKLTREECARAYHIPLPMVGILDHATFSNIKEQHKNLYQDSLGPWLAMIEGDIDLQLLPEFEGADGVYVEFNIAEKLQGSFEEQTEALGRAVGRPWMTANEARARQNLPAIGGDADRLVTPLNVLVAGEQEEGSRLEVEGSREDEEEEGEGEIASAQTARLAMTKALDVYNGALRGRHEEQWRRALVAHYRRQEAAMVSRVPSTALRQAQGASGRGPQTTDRSPGDARKEMIGGIWWDSERWDRELGADLLRLNALTAGEWAQRTVEALESDVGAETLEARMQPWLEEHSRVQAAYLNGYTRDQVAAALREPEPLEAVKGVFEQALSVWAVREAASAVTTALNFGSVEGAAATGLRTKTWQVNSGNPRPSHAAMNGETVGIRQRFSNGGRWPGDPALGAEENANCMCSVVFGK